MADVLTAPLAVAALVLIVAGVAKLRAPAPAAAALRELGLPAAALPIRAFATRRDRARLLADGDVCGCCC